MAEQVFKKIMVPTVLLLLVLYLLPDFFLKVPVCLFFLLTGVTLSFVLSYYKETHSQVNKH